MHWEPERFARYVNPKDSRYFADIDFTPGCPNNTYRVTYKVRGSHGDGVVKTHEVEHLSNAMNELEEAGYTRE